VGDSRSASAGREARCSKLFSVTFLETERLLFRSHKPEDEDDFVKMHTDPEVRRYVGGEPWPLEKAVHRFRTEYLGQPREVHGLWATILKYERRYVGCCGLRLGADEASLGYYIARPYWGKGIASEACRAFIDVAFRRLQLSRVSATVEKGHAASEHILRKFGFQYVSEEHVAASARIICLYQLLRSEWENPHGADLVGSNVR
jgi:[ribosomal protein S5]-alanine N-acetyltransferase